MPGFETLLRSQAAESVHQLALPLEKARVSASMEAPARFQDTLQ